MSYLVLVTKDGEALTVGDATLRLYARHDGRVRVEITADKSVQVQRETAKKKAPKAVAS